LLLIDSDHKKHLETTMQLIAYTIVGLGILLGLAGDVMILTTAYGRGRILFIACLALPFVALAFAVVHIRKLWLALALSLGGCIIAFIGVRLAGSDKLMEILFS
jgi:hypothetical protein